MVVRRWFGGGAGLVQEAGAEYWVGFGRPLSRPPFSGGSDAARLLHRAGGDLPAQLSIQRDLGTFEKL